MSNQNSARQLTDFFGIVSPCSTCSNQRAENDPIKGLRACPRRAAMLLRSQLQEANLTTIQVDPLALSGNEDNPNTSNTGLVNPVYSTAMNSVLVWVATIVDNKSIIDKNGNVINPGLLDPAFDTNYINCREKPVSPADNESVYRSKGAWAEGDQLHIKIVDGQQTVTSSNNQDLPVLLNGFADKVNFSYSAPRVDIERDYSVAGT